MQVKDCPLSAWPCVPNGVLQVACTGYHGPDTVTYRSTKVGLDLICEPIATPRKTKIVCTLGPKCWSEQGLAMLLENGMSIAR